MRSFPGGKWTVGTYCRGFHNREVLLLPFEKQEGVHSEGFCGMCGPEPELRANQESPFSTSSDL